jgi:hypothetical protein
MPTPRDQLLQRLRDCLSPKPEILEAYLFGSSARGEAAAHSDVDVAVYVDPSMLPDAPFGYAAGLLTEMMSALGTNAVDLVVLNRASPLLYHRVLRDGIRISSRDLAASTTREARALSRYFDYACQLRKIDAAHRKRIERGAFGR